MAEKKPKPTCNSCDGHHTKANPLVQQPYTEEAIKTLKSCVSTRVEHGDTDCKPLHHFLQSIDEKKEEDRKKVCYHVKCRSRLTNSIIITRLKTRFQAASSAVDVLSPPKPGRPSASTQDITSPPNAKRGRSSADVLSPPSRTRSTSRPRSKTTPKVKLCMFRECGKKFCTGSVQGISKVSSDIKGLRLVQIKNTTTNDKVRVACSELVNAGDASALEKWYHTSCFIEAERSCVANESDDVSKLSRHVCDCELIIFVKESLSGTSVERQDVSPLNMNDINVWYIARLNDRGIHTEQTANFKKYLKALLQKCIPNIQFVAPLNPNQSYIVTLPKVVSKAVDAFLAGESGVSNIIEVATELRHEVLANRKWSFSGDFSTWKPPTLLEFVMKQIMIGPKQHKLSGIRKDEASKSVDVVCQMICQNTKSDRQIVLKSERAFKTTVETPLSIGLPMTIHSRFRNFIALSNLSEVYVGQDYRKFMELEKCIEYAVLDRISDTGWYCLPDFVRKGVNIWFAVDNIDFLEDTAYGQNTLHGTILVIFQRDEKGDPINPPLKIPLKLPDNLISMQIKYKDDPTILRKPIRFTEFVHDFGGDLEKYQKFTETWALSSMVGNETVDVAGTSLHKVVPMDDTEVDTVEKAGDDTHDIEEEQEHDRDEHNTDEVPDLQYDDPYLLPQDQEYNPDDLTAEEREYNQPHIQVEDGMDEDIITDEPDDVNEPEDDNENNTDDISGNNSNDANHEANTQPLISVIKKREPTKKLKKVAVMPTWTATQHLLAKHKQESDPVKTNTEVVSPILQTSPTDWGTLYTVLCMAQNISAVVVGPNHRVVITLDMDLYKRAIQLQESVKNKHWLLQPGHLHKFFADLHALGKVIEGSGLDTMAVETGIFSAAGLRSVLGGKQYTRGVEFHIMWALAILMTKMEAVLGSEFPEALKEQTKAFKKALHDDKEESDVNEIYEDLSSFYQSEVKPKMVNTHGGLSQYLDNYVEQVEVMLSCIAAIHSRDLEACLTAIDQGVKYYGAMDLNNYFAMIPVYLGQMNEVKKTDKETWEKLKSNFVVTKSTIAFCNLFIDQGLEQQIKNLKRYGALPGLTQEEGALNHFITTAPHLMRYVEQFLGQFPRSKSPEGSKNVHHQLQGNAGLRCALNSVRLKNCLAKYCQGNAYARQIPLKHITLSVVIPEKAADDILNYPSKGQQRYLSLIEERFIPTSTLSIWDTLRQIKLKRFATWMAKTKVKVGDKVIKLRADRAFLGRCLLIARSRPELIPQLPELVGQYELSVIPRTNFAPDGSMLLTNDKASLMTLIREKKPVPLIDEDYMKQVTGDKTRVLVVDAMCEVRALKKKPGTKKICDLKEAFIKNIMKKIADGKYTEVHIMFDRYDLAFSLKEKTRANRADNMGMVGAESSEGHDIHDEMSLHKISINDLMSCSKTKGRITKHFAEGLLEETKNNQNLRLIVAYENKIRINSPHVLPASFRSHDHEEADTQIPLHVLHSISDSTYKHIDVESLDTDVCILLMDLVSRSHLGALTSLILHTGKGKKIDIVERVKTIGKLKSQGLIGVHNFTGTDWGGKFVGVSKRRWGSTYMDLLSNDPIVIKFGLLGSLTAEELMMENESLHENIQPLEKFVCKVYNKDGPATLPEARWELFKAKNLESENLPPARATLLPHIQRTNFVCRLNKAYTTTHPAISSLTENGWVKDASGIIKPVHCLKPPAPKAVLELVKCNCKRTDCSSDICSCYKAHMPCTDICGCTKEGTCSNECAH